jgi:thiol peroxidase
MIFLCFTLEVGSFIGSVSRTIRIELNSLQLLWLSLKSNLKIIVMAQVTLKGNPVNTIGELPTAGGLAPKFTLVKSDLSEVALSDFEGQKIVLNIFPSIDTGTCATSVRTFNEKAAGLDNTVVLCISKDLPFAIARFCGAEGIDQVVSLSAFRDVDFQNRYGVEIVDGPLKGLLARSIVVINEEGEIVYNELVPEIVDEPDYESALNAL